MAEIFDIVTDDTFQKDFKKLKQQTFSLLYARSRDLSEIGNRLSISNVVDLSSMLECTAAFYIKSSDSNIKEFKISVQHWVAETAMDGNFIGFFHIKETNKKREFTVNKPGKRKYTHSTIEVNVSFTHKSDYDLFEREFMIMCKLADM